MERRFSTLIILCLCSLVAVAQKVTVSGLVMDGALNEPLAGASVVLLQPKDSAQATGVSSDLEGKFKLPAVKAGNYIFRISYMGFQTYYRNITLPKGNKSVNLGSITLEENSKVLKEAEVTAKLAQVEMKADTFIFNAEAYRLPEGSMLEELVKKLPGAEIDDDGSIKINGKSVSKIMVDGKEYFQNDTKMALKNLPSKLIKKLKSYDKKSDYTRITGIDDGEEETVLDLSVKKGMKEGWVGNIDGAYGTEDRYSAKANVNRFLDNSYLSVIGSRNNVNDFGGRWGGGGNGIVTSTMGGVTFAWENGKPDYSAGLLKLGGNVVGTQHIRTGAVSTAKIANEAVTHEKIGVNAVDRDNIQDGEIVAGKIASGAVTAEKLADGSIGEGKIADGAVTADKVASGSIGTAKIAAEAVTAEKIKEGAVGSDKIENGAVDSDKVADYAITPDKIADNVEFVRMGVASQTLILTTGIR